MQAIEHECLDKFIVFGQEHLDLICREYVEHYHVERPHQGMGNCILIKAPEPTIAAGEVMSGERLGGVLRHYYRAVA